MDIGVIGLQNAGAIIVGQLLKKTAHNLFVYDPDGCRTEKAVTVCPTAAELCDRCQMVIVSMESTSDLTALYNGIAQFIRPGQIFIDLTDTSPALAHAVAQGMRRREAYYLDCGVFGKNGLAGPFILFAGGNGDAFTRALPLIRCFAHDCRYMGPSGRGRAARLFCRSLIAQIEHSIEETMMLARSFHMDEIDFFDSLHHIEKFADPFAMLDGEQAVLEQEQLKKDAAIVAEMARRAGLSLEGLFAATE